MNPKDMTSGQKKKIKPIKPLHIITANGRITIKRAATIYVATLECWLTFLVIEDSPPLISPVSYTHLTLPTILRV